MNAELAAGYVSSEAVTRHFAKSFYFSSIVLFGHRRRGAMALYAFCRRLDEVVDGAETDSQRLGQELNRAQELIDAVFGGADLPNQAQWPRVELLALRDTVKRFQISKYPFDELILGMKMDIEKNRYTSVKELELYCFRVAGVVGLMMAPLLGTTNQEALAHAADLGKAMQLTNILRDIKEDWQRGRVYLSQDQLLHFRVKESDLNANVPSHELQLLVKSEIERARSLYDSALKGVPFLSGFGSKRVVRLMAALYGGILDVLEDRPFQILKQRARLTLLQKVVQLVKILVTPNPKSVPHATGRVSS
jgi:15-cis-phytoene synthase